MAPSRTRFDEIRANRWGSAHDRAMEVHQTTPLVPEEVTPDPGGMWILDGAAINTIQSGDTLISTTHDEFTFTVIAPDGRSRGIFRGHQVQVDFEESASYRGRTTDRPPGYWKMRNGSFIAMIDMEDSHLENTILMLQRTANNRGRIVRPSGPYAELIDERNRRLQRLQGFLAGQPTYAPELLNAIVNERQRGIHGGIARQAGNPDGQAPEEPKEVDRPQGRRIKLDS